MLDRLPVDVLRVVCRIAIESAPPDAQRASLMTAASVARACRALRSASCGADWCRARNDALLAAAIDRASTRVARYAARQVAIGLARPHAFVRLPSTRACKNATFFVEERRAAGAPRANSLRDVATIKFYMAFWNARLADGCHDAHDRLWRGVQDVLRVSTWTDETHGRVVAASASAKTSPVLERVCSQTTVLVANARAAWCDVVRQVSVCCSTDRFELEFLVDFAGDQSRGDAVALVFTAYVRAALDAHDVSLARRVDYVDGTAVSLA